MKILFAVSAILFTTSAMAAEVVLPPSREAIDAFNECQRKGRDECVWPERRVVVPDDLVVAGPSSIDEGRAFYQAPPDEEYSGQVNRIMRERVRDADGYRTYQWGFVRTQDGPAEPFGSYNGRDRADASTAGQESAASGRSQAATGDTSPGGDNGASAPSERSDTGDGGGSSRGGEQCAR